MSLITVSLLISAGVTPTQARIFADPLSAACALFDISTPARACAFIGQCMVESARFTKTEEDLMYKRPERILAVFPRRVHSLWQASQLVGRPKELANYVYAGVNGNNPLGDDGWVFRGRGLIGLTGRGNYHAAGIGLGRPYTEQPDLVAQPPDACLTAAWFWHSHNLNPLADTAQIDAITRAVNGRAMLHADLRRQYTEEALQAWA